MYLSLYVGLFFFLLAFWTANDSIPPLTPTPTVEQESKEIVWNFAIFIDAGSSGSRVHIYEYSDTDPSTVPLIRPSNISHSWILKVEPGKIFFSFFYI